MKKNKVYILAGIGVLSFVAYEVMKEKSQQTTNNKQQQTTDNQKTATDKKCNAKGNSSKNILLNIKKGNVSQSQAKIFIKMLENWENINPNRVYSYVRNYGKGKLNEF